MDWALNIILQLWLLSEWLIVVIICLPPFAIGVAAGWYLHRRSLDRRF